MSGKFVYGVWTEAFLYVLSSSFFKRVLCDFACRSVMSVLRGQKHRVQTGAVPKRS